ncbi:MAG: hypothetical protein MZV65_28525 [Chromatiales bacterium]|nr:hypothetical protein [Chromatiales bacterium]
MPSITFQEYCEDHLDLHIGLMSEQQLTEARAGYQALLDAARAAVAQGEALLSAKRPTKAEFIAHAAQNSDASRLMNAATRSL